jgi:anti-anti-sigma factor
VSPPPTASPTDPAATDAWDGHQLLLHESEAERVAGLIDWARRGLDRGEKVVLGEAPPGGRPPTLMQLRRHGWDPAPALAARRLEVLPVHRFYRGDSQREIVDAAFAEGFGSVRLAAESSAALEIMSAEDYGLVERTMEELCRTGTVSALCQYARSRTVGPTLTDAVEVHVRGVRQRLITARDSGTAVLLTGEVDISNADVLSELVGAATRAAQRDGRDASVDLDGLRFLDAAGVSAVLRGSAGFRAAGGLLRLTRPRPFVARILHLLALDEEPGVRIGGPTGGDGR